MIEKTVNPFYRTAAWKRVRKQALDRDVGMCVDCMALFEQGLIRQPSPATVVHHVLHLEDRPDLGLDLDNLISLCDTCHNRRHPEKGQAIQKTEKHEKNRRFAVAKL